MLCCKKGILWCDYFALVTSCLIQCLLKSVEDEPFAGVDNSDASCIYIVVTAALNENNSATVCTNSTFFILCK